MKHLRRFNESQTIKATDETIQKILREEVVKLGYNANLNHIDVSEVSDMSHLFSTCSLPKFYGDISLWNTENVINMCNMFHTSKFNGDITSWNVKNVHYMNGMFFGNNYFNQDLNGWKPLQLRITYSMFDGCHLKHDPPHWFTFIDLSFFMNGEDYFNSLKKFDWLRPGKVIKRKRFLTAIDHYDGSLENIRELKSYKWED